MSRYSDLLATADKPRSKYGAKKTNGYDSQAEANRAAELALMARAGKITGLREQVPFEIIPKQDGERAAHYVCDFMYQQDGAWIVEDVKGFKTPAYVLKRKLMRLVHGVVIREVAA